MMFFWLLVNSVKISETREINSECTTCLKRYNFYVLWHSYLLQVLLTSLITHWARWKPHTSKYRCYTSQNLSLFCKSSSEMLLLKIMSDFREARTSPGFVITAKATNGTLEVKRSLTWKRGTGVKVRPSQAWSSSSTSAGSWRSPTTSRRRTASTWLLKFSTKSPTRKARWAWPKISTI